MTRLKADKPIEIGAMVPAGLVLRLDKARNSGAVKFSRTQAIIAAITMYVEHQESLVAQAN